MKRSICLSLLSLCVLLPGEAQVLKKLKKAAESVAKSAVRTPGQPADAANSIAGQPGACPRLTDRTVKVDLDGSRVSHAFHDGMAAFISDNSKLGFIDRQGRIAVEPLYQEALAGVPRFDGGHCVVRKTMEDYSMRYAIIDKTGGETLLPKTVRYASDYGNGRLVVVEQTGNGFVTYFAGADGRKTLPAMERASQYEPSVRPGAPRAHIEGLAAYYDAAADAWGYYDAAGQTVVAPAYDAAQDFSEGLAAVKAKGKHQWLYIDKTGRVVITLEPDHMAPSPFKGGLAAVRKSDGRYYAIDRTGRVVSPEGYVALSQFVDGHAFIIPVTGNTAVIDATFKRVADLGSILYLPKGAACYNVVAGEGRGIIGTSNDPAQAMAELAVDARGKVVFRTGLPKGKGRFSNWNDGLAWCEMTYTNGAAPVRGFIDASGEFVMTFR